MNDVLLAMTAGGLRNLLSSRGEPVEPPVADLRARLVPPRAAGSGTGNLIAQMVVPLPIGVTDPVLRLRLIAAETAKRKARSRPSLGMFRPEDRRARFPEAG